VSPVTRATPLALIALAMFAVACGEPADGGVTGGASGAGMGGAGAGGGGTGGAGLTAGTNGTSGTSAGTGGSATGGAGGAGASGMGGTAGGGMAGSGTGGSGMADSGVAGSGMAGSSGTGGGGGTAGSPGCGKMGQTGTFQAMMTAAGLQRGYYMSVPASYNPNVPQRLVFGYHGSNYNGTRMRRYLDLEREPLLTGTIFVYPDGLPLPNQADHIAWVLDANGRDLAFFDELLAKLQSEYCIDSNRILVNGQSFGGLMTNAVGCLRGNVVRAIAVVAGSGPRNSSMCQGQVAAWLTHGMDDESVSFTSGEVSRNYWVQANHCMNMSMPGTPSQCQYYQGCDAGHPVIWCPHVGDAGHQHPSFGREAVRQFFAQY
jgi:polyhydroxybutyrate depolymerase